MSSKCNKQQLCEAVGRYYKSKNAKYEDVKTLTQFMDENGIDSDEENLEEEINEHQTDSVLIDFDDDNPFPFTEKPDDRKQAIYEILKRCFENPHISWDYVLPKIDDKSWATIQDANIEEIKKIYKEQVPTVYNKGMKQDVNLLTVLHIQHFKQFDYLLNLVDLYDRDRIKKVNEDANYDTAKWVSECGHILKKKDLKIKFPQMNSNKKESKDKPSNNNFTQYSDICKHAVNSFGSRCCDRLILNSVRRINDSLERTVKWIEVATTFIANLIQTQPMGLLPFQLDVVFAVGEPERTTKSDSKDDNDDDEDEDDEEEDENANDPNDKGSGPFADVVGDIDSKLKKNKIPYVKERVNLDSDEYKDTRVFNQLLNKYRQNNGIKENGNHLLFQKRFIVLIDRRTSKDSDDIDDVYFGPAIAGKYTRDIPKDAVPEWGVSASRTCLLPSMNYKQSKAINDNIAKDLDADVEKKDNNPSEDKNIGTAEHCHGALLTASFHVRQEDKIKMYLYYNGGMIRFIPNDDIKVVLPRIFVENHANKAFIENKDLDETMNRINRNLIDKEFDVFQGH